jgi:hypothetical protein
MSKAHLTKGSIDDPSAFTMCGAPVNTEPNPNPDDDEKCPTCVELAWSIYGFRA